MEVKEGELVGWEVLTGSHKLNAIHLDLCTLMAKETGTGLAWINDDCQHT